MPWPRIFEGRTLLFYYFWVHGSVIISILTYQHNGMEFSSQTGAVGLDSFNTSVTSNQEIKLRLMKCGYKEEKIIFHEIKNNPIERSSKGWE